MNNGFGGLTEADFAYATAEIVKVAGNLHQVGNFVEGTFNPSTKAFTATSE